LFLSLRPSHVENYLRVPCGASAAHFAAPFPFPIGSTGSCHGNTPSTFLVIRFDRRLPANQREHAAYHRVPGFVIRRPLPPIWLFQCFTPPPAARSPRRARHRAG